jgi:hypothetical protein
MLEVTQEKTAMHLFLFIYLFPLVVCAYNDGSLLPPFPHPLPLAPTPSLLPNRYCFALISNFVEEKV